MSGIYVAGCGVVSPAGWGMAPFRAALDGGKTLRIETLKRPGNERPLRVRPVPPPEGKPGFLGHARLRRTSPIAQYVVASALEALGGDAASVENGQLSLGIVVCVMSACVIYSRRFYDETLKNPATASPLVFPETVFNSPASHLAALLGSRAINYTLVGDPGIFLQGLALGAEWLVDGRVDGCLVVGAEESDWLSSEAFQIFDREVIVSAGAGALYLRREPKGTPAVQLRRITDPQPYTRRVPRANSVRRVRTEIGQGTPADLLCDSLHGLAGADRAENEVWDDWPGPRLSPRKTLGEGLMAGAAWQCVAAIDALQQGKHPTAVVSVVGCNQQAMAAEFAVV